VPKAERDKIEYEFDDLRRNTDPVSSVVLAHLGIDNEGDVDERQDGKKRREAARRKERGENDGSDDDHDDRDLLDDAGLDEDEEVTLSRKELARQLTQTRRQAERKARQEILEARGEAAEVIGKLSKRVDGIERKGNQTEIDAEFGPKIADLEQQIETAMEGGDTKKVVALNRQLGELTADRKIKIHQATQAKDDGDDSESAQPVRPKVPQRAQKWINRQDWFDDPEYAHVKAYLHKVDRDLLADDFDPDDDAYWAKLERKLEAKFPGVITPTVKKRRAKDDDEDDEDDDDDRHSRRKDDDDDDDDDRDDRSSRNRRRQRGAAERSPVSEGDRGGASRGSDGEGRRRRGEVTLSRSQVANMRAFGLDPDNKAHVEEYTLEVQRQQRADRR
jgi:hypothetical protein